LKDDFKQLMDYVHKMEDKYGTVTLMDKWESLYMLKLSCPCYRNDCVNLNQYEITVIGKYLKGYINIRQLSHYLGGITGKKANYKAKLYKAGRYELKNHKNY